jgi:hypothetical protein
LHHLPQDHSFRPYCRFIQTTVTLLKMFCTRSMLQLGTACLMLLAFFALFSFSDTRSITWEPTIVSGSGDVRFDRSRIPPPDFNSAQLKVNADEPADDPIWDTQNSTLGVSLLCGNLWDWMSNIKCSSKRSSRSLCHIVRTSEIILRSCL